MPSAAELLSAVFENRKKASSAMLNGLVLQAFCDAAANGHQFLIDGDEVAEVDASGAREVDVRFRDKSLPPLKIYPDEFFSARRPSSGDVVIRSEYCQSEITLSIKVPDGEGG